MVLHLYKKVFISSLLAGALYYAATCPCEVYLECHRKYYNLFLLAALAVPELFWNPRSPLKLQ